jgi:hypothetical protein
VTTVSVCSAKGSPGATTLACAIGAVWPAERRIVVAECDPSGGDLAAKFNLSAKRGMTSLVLEARRSSAEGLLELGDHLQSLPGGLEILAGPTGAAAGNTVDAALPDVLGRRKPSSGDDGPDAWADLVLDCGRIQFGNVGQSAAIRASHHVLVVARPTVESVASTRWLAEQLNRSTSPFANNEDPLDALDKRYALEDHAPFARSHGAERAVHAGTAGLVLVGSGAVEPSQAEEALALPLLAVIPEDRIAAAALRGEPMFTWRLARSALVSSARDLVTTLLETPTGTGTSESSEKATDKGHSGTGDRNARLFARSIRFALKASHVRARGAEEESVSVPARYLPPKLLVGREDQ